MTIKHRADPYAALRASRVRAAAKRRTPAPEKAKAASEPQEQSYAHLHGATLSYGQISRPAAPQPPSQAEKAIGFAERMEQVAARVAGRGVRDLLPGPKQGVVKATGSDLVAALQRREAARTAATGRR